MYVIAGVCSTSARYLASLSLRASSERSRSVTSWAVPISLSAVPAGPRSISYCAVRWRTSPSARLMR